MANERITSGYDILPQFVELGKKYFGDELSTQRIGMFGLLTEQMAMSFDKLLLDSNFRAREFHTVTARRRSTLEQEAAVFKIDPGSARPATMEAFLGVNIADIFTKGKNVGQDYEFVIDKDTVVDILGYSFMSEFDILIRAKKIDIGYSYLTQFVDATDTTLTQLNNPYLNNSRIVEGDMEILMIKVPLRQMSKEYKYHTVIQNDLINLTGVEFDYTDSLAYFNVYYREAGSNIYEPVELHSLYDSSSSINKYFLYQNDVENHKILIYANEFIPKFNSEIRVDIYTTKGSQGNFAYSGDGSDITVRLKSFNDTRDYVGVFVGCTPISDSVGGADVPGLEGLRRELIFTKSTLKGLDTEKDIEKHFNDEINNIQVVKKRSDVMERRYSLYMIPRDTDSTIIPSSTLNIRLTEDDFDVNYPQTYRKVVKAHAKFSLFDGSTDTLVRNHDPQPGDEEDTNRLLFGTPYLMVVNTQPMYVSFYHNSLDQQYTMNARYINSDITTQFVVNFITVRRNAIIGEDSYRIEFNVIPNGDISGIVDDDGNIIPDTFMIKGLIYSRGGDIVSYFDTQVLEYNSDENYFRCEAFLTTNDYLSPENDLELINTLYELGSSTVSPSTVVPGNGLEIGLAIYTKISDEIPTEETYSHILPAEYSDYTLTNIYSNINNRTDLYVDMTDNVKSVLTYIDEGEYLLEEIPLVRSSYIERFSSRMSDIVLNTKAELQRIGNLMTNNFSLDYKFFRTYGKATYFKIGESDQPLDRLDLYMQFKVYVRPVIQILESDLVKLLKSSIKRYVESLNTDSEDFTIFITNIITAVENDFAEYIRAIDLLQLNDYDQPVRIIRYTKPDFRLMTSTEIRRYVPEYINLPLDKIDIIIAK